MKVLRSALQRMLEEQPPRSRRRPQQVGSGDRSERIRTIISAGGSRHRIGLTLYKRTVLNGDLDGCSTP
jgi:protein subunit release factor A